MDIVKKICIDEKQEIALFFERYKKLNINPCKDDKSYRDESCVSIFLNNVISNAYSHMGYNQRVFRNDVNGRYSTISRMDIDKRLLFHEIDKDISSGIVKRKDCKRIRILIKSGQEDNIKLAKVIVNNWRNKRIKLKNNGKASHTN